MDIVVLIARILFVSIFVASGIGHLTATKAM
ncbi:MAG: DoxX family protein, partial [Acetobacteraceae bacterium]